MIAQNTLQAAYMAYARAFAEGFMKAEAGAMDWELLAQVTTSTTESEEYGWLANVGSVREWVGERVIHRLAEHGMIIKNKSFEKTFGVSRNKLEDSQWASFNPVAQMLGEDTRLFPNSLVFPLLVNGWTNKGFDGQPFFDANHPVVQADGKTVLYSNNGGGTGTAWYLVATKRTFKPIIYQKRRDFKFVALDQQTDTNTFLRSEYLYGVDGRCNVGYGFWQTIYASRQPLTADNVQAARVEMMKIKNGAGNPLGIVPDTLLVPPTLGKAAREITDSVIVNNTTNVMKGTLNTVETAWLL